MPASNVAYSSPSYPAAPITGDRLAALSAASVRQLWAKGVEVWEQTSDFFAEMEGRGAMSIIQTETDLAKGAGQKITFTNRSGLYGEAHTGDDLFTDSSHYEELLLGSNELNVDWFRHSVRYTERAEEKMGMRGELMDDLPDALGQWAGRLKTENQFMLFRERAPSENKVTLTGSLTWNSIVEYAQMMKRWGAPPAKVGTDAAGRAVRGYCIVACTDALTSLELDPNFLQALREAGTRGPVNSIFTGGYTNVRGHVIREFEAIEHDGYGAIGSPLNPMARLGTAMTALDVAAANYIVGGGSDYDANNILVKPTKWFPDFAFKFLAGDALAAGTDDFYVAIVNPPNAATDPNKYGFYKIGVGQPVALVANNGVKLAIASGLAAVATAATGATSGAAKVTTLGGVTWDATKHTNNHPVDALVVLVDSNAKALFDSLVLSAACARRGYGKYRNRRTTQDHEGGFVRDVYFNTVFGNALRSNRKGRVPGVLRLRHTGKYAGLPLPS